MGEQRGEGCRASGDSSDEEKAAKALEGLSQEELMLQFGRKAGEGFESCSMI